MRYRGDKMIEHFDTMYSGNYMQAGMKYKLRFMPEYYATSLWAQDQATEDIYGYEISYQSLGLSKALIEALEAYDEKILSLIDWKDPAGPFVIHKDERKALYENGLSLLEDIKKELGNDFQIINESQWIL